MPSRSSLARLQQAIVLVLAAVSSAWIAWQWHRSPVAAIGGALLLVFAYSLFLAAEFILLKVAGGDRHTPPPTWGEAIRAWWGETCTTPRVFYWRQPFRWRAVPDSLDAPAGRRGVVLVHGFVCNRGLWNPWMRALRAASHPFIAVNLEPVFGSIEDYAGIIDDAVRRLTAATGQPPLIVCHSMGGLAVRHWLREAALPVHHVVTIGTPHRGTWLGRFSHTANGRQMRLDGEWVAALAARQPRVPFTCWYSNCDNIVFPASTATLPGADNRLVRGIAHVQLAFRREVMEPTLQLLAAS
jgi:pimeloyl-ACP methyl ester carboxylesterase